MRQEGKSPHPIHEPRNRSMSVAPSWRQLTPKPPKKEEFAAPTQKCTLDKPAFCPPSPDAVATPPTRSRQARPPPTPRTGRAVSALLACPSEAPAAPSFVGSSRLSQEPAWGAMIGQQGGRVVVPASRRHGHQNQLHGRPTAHALWWRGPRCDTTRFECQKMSTVDHRRPLFNRQSSASATTTIVRSKPRAHTPHRPGRTEDSGVSVRRRRMRPSVRLKSGLAERPSSRGVGGWNWPAQRRLVAMTGGQHGHKNMSRSRCRRSAAAPAPAEPRRMHCGGVNSGVGLGIKPRVLSAKKCVPWTMGAL